MLPVLANGGITPICSTALAEVQNFYSTFDGQEGDGSRFAYRLTPASTCTLTRGQYPSRVLVDAKTVGRGLDQRLQGRMAFLTESVDSVNEVTVYGTRKEFRFVVSYDLPCNWIDPVAGIWAPRVAFGALLGYDGTNATITSDVAEDQLLYPWLGGQR